MKWERIKALFRQRVDDAVGPPFKWSPDDVDEYAEAAQLDAVRRSHMLVTSSKAPAVAPVSAGEALVPLDRRVMFIRRARMASQATPLVIRPSRVMDEMMPGWEAAKPGTPQVLIPDGENGFVRLYPPPAVDDELRMTVVHEPLKPVVGADSDAEPEIPERHQRALVAGMAELAYLRPDSETFNPDGAAKAAAEFAREFGEKISGKDEQFGYEQYYDVGDFQ